MLARHLVAHTRRGDSSLVDAHEGPWLWKHLQQGFPNADALMLMPDHVHLADPRGDEVRFRRILGGFTREFGASFDILPPAEIRSPEILARALRYVFLNPVRARIVDDPWTWPWSTLRDLVAAVHPIWTDARTISRRTRIPGRELVTRLTTTADARYEIPHASEQLAMSLLGARSATAAALRVPFDETITDRAARRLVVQLLYASGTPHATTLATELGCTRRTIHNLLQQPHPALSAALLCISDPRLSRLAPGFPIFERSAP